MNTVDYTELKLSELLQLCKDRGLKGCSGKKKSHLIALLMDSSATALVESEFVLQPMITYIGNKRKLVPWIMEVVEEIREVVFKSGQRKFRVMDGFAGSGVVSRALMSLCTELHSNDMEYYSYVLLRCFLETPSCEMIERIKEHFTKMLELCQNATEVGFVTRLYAPKNTSEPLAGERVFYTRENAMIIDTLIKYIFSVEEDIRCYLMGPLLIKASINVNTAGVFRGFYKKDGVGHFGGVGENALERILAPIIPVMPVWSNNKCLVECHNSSIVTLMEDFCDDTFDLIYLDPPYNEHPYGSNYFMLNLIALGQEPTEYSKVSGIPVEWNKTPFNGRKSAYGIMEILLHWCLKKGKYILLSYNNEGLIGEEEWATMFEELECTVKKYEKEYDTYHGSRNLDARNKKVVEIMYLITKQG
jgi:adenine-specific DNA-methyltransferase